MSLYALPGRSGPVFLSSRSGFRPTARTGYPDATNTGTLPGVTRTTYSGPTTITTAGTLIENKNCDAGFIIQANNVTFRNCSITCGGFFWGILSDNGNTGLTVTDCEFDGQNNSATDSCLSGDNYYAARLNVHGSGDGIKAGSNCTIVDSYIHDLAVTAEGHNDGIQSLGTTSLTIRHNTITMAALATSCIILSTGSATDMRNILIEDNLFTGANYCCYGGYQSGVDDVNKVSNIVIRNNRISTVVAAQGGTSGPFTSVDSPVVTSGNLYYDGSNTGQPAT